MCLDYFDIDEGMTFIKDYMPLHVFADNVWTRYLHFKSLEVVLKSDLSGVFIRFHHIFLKWN